MVVARGGAVGIPEGEVRYFPCVDFLRGLGAFAILIWHYHHFYLTKAYFSPETGVPVWDHQRQPFYSALTMFYDHGGFAVQFFWLLSGFVFAFVYSRRSPRARDFFILRFSRLYPLHFLTLLLIAGLQAISLRLIGKYQVVAINDSYHFLLNLFFAQWWGFQQGYSFNSPSWSISVEELIYWAFWLVAIRLGVRSLHGLALAAILFVGLSTRWWASDISWCGFFFFAGALTYTVQRRSRPVMMPAFAAALLIAAAAAYGLVSWAGFQGSISKLPFIARHLAWVNASLGNAGLAGLFSALVLIAAYVDRADLLPRARRIFLFTGSLTYPTYMLHLPIQVAVLVVVDLWGVPRALFDSGLVLIGYVIVMVILGTLLVSLS